MSHARHHLQADRRWRKRLVSLPTIMVMLIASVAVAVLVSRQDSAPDQISAKAIGSVDIGDVATAGLFTADLTNLSPGAGFFECFNVALTAPGNGRVYTLQASGDLADDLIFTLRDSTVAPVGPTGHTTCSESSWTTIYEGPLAGLAAALPDYAGGYSWGGGSHLNVILELPATVDEAAVAGQTATLQMAFENQG